MSKTIPRDTDLADVTDVLPGSAAGFTHLISRTMASVPLSRKAPKVTGQRGAQAPDAEDDSPPPSLSGTQPAGEKPVEDNNFNSMLLLGFFLDDKVKPEDGTFGSFDVVSVLSKLEKMGVPVDPFKRAIESVTGQTYAEFAAAGNNTRYDAAAFFRNPSYSSGMERATGGPCIATGFNSARAIQIANTDGVGKGMCGRGVYSILTNMGIPITSANGTDWDDKLAHDRRFRKIDISLQDLRSGKPIPEGTILTYNSDVELDRAARNRGGGKSGHVEIAVRDSNGKTRFAFSDVSTHFGGTVPDNFSAAYLYVGPGAPPANLQIASGHSPRGPAPQPA